MCCPNSFKSKLSAKAFFRRFLTPSHCIVYCLFTLPYGPFPLSFSLISEKKKLDELRAQLKLFDEQRDALRPKIETLRNQLNVIEEQKKKLKDKKK